MKSKQKPLYIVHIYQDSSMNIFKRDNPPTKNYYIYKTLSIMHNSNGGKYYHLYNYDPQSISSIYLEYSRFLMDGNGAKVVAYLDEATFMDDYIWVFLL